MFGYCLLFVNFKKYFWFISARFILHLLLISLWECSIGKPMQNFMLTHARSNKLELEKTSENRKKLCTSAQKPHEIRPKCFWRDKNVTKKLQKWQTNSKRLIKKTCIYSLIRNTHYWYALVSVTSVAALPINVSSKTLLLCFVRLCCVVVFIVVNFENSHNVQLLRNLKCMASTVSHA